MTIYYNENIMAYDILYFNVGIYINIFLKFTNLHYNIATVDSLFGLKYAGTVFLPF